MKSSISHAVDAQLLPLHLLLPGPLVLLLLLAPPLLGSGVPSVRILAGQSVVHPSEDLLRTLEDVLGTEAGLAEFLVLLWGPQATVTFLSPLVVLGASLGELDPRLLKSVLVFPLAWSSTQIPAITWRLGV